MFTVADHPLVKGPHGRIFVLIQDRSAKALKAAQETAKELHVPHNNEDASRMGMMRSVRKLNFTHAVMPKGFPSSMEM
jgi:hypothetical protein